ncbi:acetaldehyde dehydrogenase (acetylating) [Sporomusa acidovorans]|uniref:Aldehyde-alcohol dehydrogenase n=1 Tax=Sporomusa acidovorans (strain ATCC 49682 / DSM 3132 / Mol) TaxID=1123286 RepID=A0ABZ3J8A0_SPOA4|nr:acetaldehyde dehydrogenase (acetylating) [Sporomusa acidovorans]OZC21237.1 aldehyde-alcohol dehydrogenase [Sporomusa acidovorans DSM 3132]SDE65615.1 acetaldehyde dehydrogenase [Sporomusa acidovorans]
MELDRDLLSMQEARNLVCAAQKAQEIIKNFSKEQIDRVIDFMRQAGETNAAKLAMMAVSETGMGNYEDKCLKNYFASHHVYEFIKDMKTIGVINEDKKQHMVEIAEPVGIIVGIVPTTNPTSTVIYKSMIALKARNAIVFSPHPSAIKCTHEAAKLMNQAAVAAGAPEGVIGCMSTVSMQATNELMKHPDTKLILATGGSGLVKTAYSSGKPALGVGPGNVPAFVERSARLDRAAEQIIIGKTFDNGTICASEQAIVAEECIADELIELLKRNGAYFLEAEEVQKVAKAVILPTGGMSPQYVGKDAKFIASQLGITVPADTRCLVAPLQGVGPQYPLSHEKLTTVLGFYRVRDWQEGCDRCIELLESGGIGHSLVIHSENKEIIREFAMRKPVFRILVNTPSSLGGVGATTGLAPSFTLGCGTWGGSSVSENVTPLHLINVKRVAWPVREPAELTIPNYIEPAGIAAMAQNPVSRQSEMSASPALSPDMIRDIVEQVVRRVHSCKN